MNKIQRMKEIITNIVRASKSYYMDDNPIISDKQFDDLVDELEQLENETGVILSNSPIHKVQGHLLDGLQKVQHTRPMLSANKTKDMSVIKNFIAKGDTVESWKLDGLTIVVRYKNGKYNQAITRGTGDIGEDVTEAFRHCINLPLTLSKPVDIEVRGECVISWENFRKINEELSEPYTHPRNLAAGSLRNLDTNIAKSRSLEFIVFELVQDNNLETMNVLETFVYLSLLGFDVVEYKAVTTKDYEEIDSVYFNPETYKYPVDGTIYKYNDYAFGRSLGTTAHHPLNMIARKWADNLYETTLRDIEWDTSKSGSINPVALFDEVDLDGALTTRATLHNVSYIKQLQLGIGDTIQIYRSNMVIPKVHDNLTRSNTYTIPNKCPVCSAPTVIVKDNDSEVLHCTNPDCKGKLLGKFETFVSKQGMNIDGLSEATLKTFINKGWLNTYSDVYELYNHINEIKQLEGFGEKSTSKLVTAIENSKIVDLAHFITAINIPNVGKSSAKTIAEYCKWDINNFYQICFDCNFDWTRIEGFGEKTRQQISEYFKLNVQSIKKLISYLVFAIPKQKLNIEKNNISGKTFCITGKLIEYANRNALVEDIENNGGKVISSVTAKTDYLISNDSASTSSKSKKAKDLGIPIISEVIFKEMKKGE